MTLSNHDNSAIANRLLTNLPKAEYQRLEPHLEPVSLSLDEVLYEPKQPIESVYFPDRALVSLVSILEDNHISEVGLVGREGVVGIPVFLGGNFTINRAVVQLAGTAIKLDAEILKTEFNRGGELQRRLLLYTQVLFTQVSQMAAGKSCHTIEKQLARWLLTVQDCTNQDELRLTQKYLSQMLGTRRASITVAANALQEAGLIRYGRGRITLLDRENLETMAGECYRSVKSELERLLNFEESQA
jgi:CRP-like cAMP-binding protein